MSEKKHTYCRICEPHCPMLATVNEAGKVVALEPNPDHPSGGIACHKGLFFLEVHNDPDRLNWPLKRQNSRTDGRGQFARINWDTAITEVAQKIKAIRDEYGPNSIALYRGNPTAFNGPACMVWNAFHEAIGTRMQYSAATLDCSNKFYVAGEVYGSMGIITIPDIHHTDYLVCLGTNPKVSRWTLCVQPNDAGDVLKKIRARGGKVLFVNPRKTESSTEETGETLQIKPSTDVYFLAALLNEIQLQGGFDNRLVDRYGRHVDRLIDFVRRYPADRVADVTGIDVSTIKQIAKEIMAARSAAFYIATGVNQSRQGSLSSWLVEMINFVTGNLGRKGGSHKPKGLINEYAPFTGEIEFIETSLGTLELPVPAGYVVQPAPLLPELIENGDIRAMVVMSGNPLLSMGGGSELRQAFEKLDMLISIDIYLSVTAEMSDYILPATDFLERADINMLSSGMQPIPYVQYTDAMEDPVEERRNEAWILSSLLQAMGYPSPLGHQGHAGLEEMLDNCLAKNRLSVAKLRELPHQTFMFSQTDRKEFFESFLLHPDKKINCFPEGFTANGLIERCEAIFKELQAEPEQSLRLVNRRTGYMHNSWMANTAKLRRGKQTANPLEMCENDACARGLFDGDRVRLYNDHGSIEAEVEINNDLRPGVVSMSHGYGHALSGMSVAASKPGVNSNELAPTGFEAFEPGSNMSWLNGIPVSIQPLEAS